MAEQGTAVSSAALAWHKNADSADNSSCPPGWPINLRFAASAVRNLPHPASPPPLRFVATLHPNLTSESLVPLSSACRSPSTMDQPQDFIAAALGNSRLAVCGPWSLRRIGFERPRTQARGWEGVKDRQSGAEPPRRRDSEEIAALFS
jgi:hypothetical protein